MPMIYVAVHLVLAGLCLWMVRRLASFPKWSAVVGVVTLVIVLTGLAVERSAEWAWDAMRLSSPDLVFFTNVSLEGVIVLATLMWNAATDRKAKARAVMLSLPLLGVAGWSYAWYFLPLPPGLSGRADKNGLILQTSDYSCSAAAAAMLLGKHQIPATENEMAALCLTREGQGTPPLGLYRGLTEKAAPSGLRPRLVRLDDSKGFYGLHQACIIGVGIKSNVSREIKLKMENYGWQQGQRHTLVVLDADKEGRWLDVFDPSNGKERWPSGDLQYIWDGHALILTRS